MSRGCQPGSKHLVHATAAVAAAAATAGSHAQDGSSVSRTHTHTALASTHTVRSTRRHVRYHARLRTSRRIEHVRTYARTMRTPLVRGGGGGGGASAAATGSATAAVLLLLLLLLAGGTEAARGGGRGKGGGRGRHYSSRMPIMIHRSPASANYYNNKDGASIVKSSHFELDYMLGRKITFFCMAKGLPRPHITWFKDGIELYAHKFFQVHEWPMGEDTIKSKMEIDPTTQKDAGYYECQADNQYAIDRRGFRTDYVITTY